MFNVVTSSISGAYQELVGLVFSKGVEVKDERGSDTLECLNVVTTIKHPLPFSPVSVPIYNLIHPSFPTFGVMKGWRNIVKNLLVKTVMVLFILMVIV